MCVPIPIKTITRPSKQCEFCFYLDESFDHSGLSEWIDWSGWSLTTTIQMVQVGHVVHVDRVNQVVRVVRVMF